MAIQVGAAGIYGLASMIAGTTTLSGYISPKFETLSLTGQSDYTEEMNQFGDIDQLVGVNKGVSCQFRYKPRGGSVATAIKAASLPNICATVVISGVHPSISAYGFNDVFNTAADSKPWIFTGDFTIDGTSTGLWTGTMTLRRYHGITFSSAVIIT